MSGTKHENDGQKTFTPAERIAELNEIDKVPLLFDPEDMVLFLLADNTSL